MDSIEKIITSGGFTALVGFLLWRWRCYCVRADVRQAAADAQERKADKYDALASAMERARTKARTCLAMFQDGEKGATLGYALTDLVSDLDLTERETARGEE